MAARFPGLFAIFIGFCLIVNPLYLFPQMDDQQYVHTIEGEVDRYEVPGQATELQYEYLSPPAKDAFDRAYNASDNTAIIRGEENTAPEFYYSFHISTNQGTYYIDYNNTYYKFSTYGGSELTSVYYFIEIPVFLFGVCLVFLGGHFYNTTRNQLYPTVLSLLGVLLLVTGPLHIIPLNDILWMVLTLVALFIGQLAAFALLYNSTRAR